MDSSSSQEYLNPQVESLKKELRECRKAQEQSQSDELKYRSLVENAMEAILVAQDGIFQYANPKAMDLFGYSQKELNSKPLNAFIHESDREMVMQRHERRLEGEDLPEVYPIRIVNKEGTTVWVELKVKLFSWNYRPAILCFMTDITKRKQAEEK
ncbi:MAG: PAS domain S-box protein, partial [Deltaproteobacteria bacterium]|nr:PAS domain S-box protein [Deltaproteobacteria bacterium]